MKVEIKKKSFVVSISQSVAETTTMAVTVKRWGRGLELENS